MLVWFYFLFPIKQKQLSTIGAYILLIILSIIWIYPILWIVLQAFRTELNDKGELIPSDMQWDMVDKLVRYIYNGNQYTDGKPVPCIINYGSPKSFNCNVHKLTNILLKTSNEVDSVYTNAGDTISTYYLNVLDNIITYKGENEDEKPSEES